MKKLMKNKYSVPVLAVVVFGISLVLNGLAGTTLLGGNTTAQVSDAYPNLFAPAGITFTIWGIIYLLLAAYCVRLFTKFGKKHDKSAHELALKVAPYFIAISAINAAWILAWQYRVIWLSVLLIVAMLVLLARIALMTRGAKLALADWTTIVLPFNVYFGWITIATIANITTWLVSVQWDGWGLPAPAWTIIMLGVGAMIGVVTAWRIKSWVYLAVFIWAYDGIWLKHMSAQGFNNQHPAITTLLLQLMLVLGLSAVWVAYISRPRAKRHWL